MYYKLSNIASLKEIESVFDARFSYPNIYEPKQQINGLEEQQVPVILQGFQKSIEPAIWGLMPEGMNEDWSHMQEEWNTLNLDLSDLDEIPWLDHPLERQRCVILVTGFFSHSIANGKMQPYHVHLDQYKPFPIAAIYTRLPDGFLTCALLTTSLANKPTGIQQLGAKIPLALPDNHLRSWISQTTSAEDLMHFWHNHPRLPFHHRPVSPILYRSMGAAGISRSPLFAV